MSRQDNSLYWEKYAEECIRKMINYGSTILFDVEKTNWNKPHGIISNYCSRLFLDISRKFDELQKSQEFTTTGHVIYAKGINRNKDLTFSIGGGSTQRASVPKHSIEWAIYNFTENHRKLEEPVNFRLFIVGCSNGNDEEIVLTPNQDKMLVY